MRIRIAVLSKGKIIERGTHQELMALGSVYTRLCNLQFIGSEDASSVRQGVS